MFKRYSKKAAVYPTESKWSVKESEHNNQPMYIRLNNSADDLAGHPDYKYRVGIAVPLKLPDEQGLPTTYEIEELNAIEDSLARRLEKDQLSLQVLSITTGNMREFVFYTKDPQSALEMIEACQLEVKTHQLQKYVKEDPGWTLYKDFI
ncbi:MAG: DUF695 domain-containing protein [Anaerolineales bacterium]